MVLTTAIKRGHLLAVFCLAASSMANSPTLIADMAVAQDGSGDFAKVQDAINAVPSNKSLQTVIFIKPGTYKEKLNVSADKKNLKLLGESHIRDEGWSIWRGRENHRTAYYVEYKNSSPGHKTKSRLGWTHQLTDEEAAAYTRENTFKATTTTAVTLEGDWNPRVNECAKKPRIVVTSDGEIDDECSMVRFLLYANEFDVEGIVKTSSQYHWQGHKWAGDDWEKPIYEAYGTLYPNLIKHDPGYPTLEYLQSITKLGNVKSDGEMTLVTAGSQHIVDVLLDETDNRPIWLQAWGGMNTIARALKTIEEEHPEKMATVAGKIRFYFIWEQDKTFQSYIRSHWAAPYNIPTIISDQFITFGYWWQRWNMPKEPDAYLRSPWMKENIFKNNNPLLAIYNEKTKIKLKGKEDFMGEGDSPSFIHMIPTGLRSTESPDWGGWGGRYVLIRESTWLDRVPVEGYQYPSGRWYTKTGWGRQNHTKADQDKLEAYFKPITRWIGAIQNDFAARVDWCVKPYAEANHQPVVKLAHALDFKVNPGATVALSAQGTSDPDGNALTYKWWQYEEADTYAGVVEIKDSAKQEASFTVPKDAGKGVTIHIICEVTDSGTPPLTRYQRVVAEIQ